MKFGVLGFSYAGFKFGQSWSKTGHYTINLGDNAQTIASRHVYSDLGCPDDQVIVIDRDTLPDYSGPPAFLIMNGVFQARHFPVPDHITPILVGFCTKSPELVAGNRDWFKRHEPVGCRDLATLQIMQDHGIEAWATGCITMCLPSRSPDPERLRLFIVYGSKAGALPAQVLRYVPPHLLDTAEMIFHRLPVGEFPLSPAASDWIEKYEGSLLRRYADEAALVLTPLLHVASPCLGLGVPVVICRGDLDSRFGYLGERMPIYTPDRVAEIDWTLPAPNVMAAARAIIDQVAASIGAAAPRG